jgi:hypothetical protein
MKDGGPAFPRPMSTDGAGFLNEATVGMTMRQFYKAQVLGTIAVTPPDKYSIMDRERHQPQKDAAAVAEFCGIYADAMIAEDNKHRK